MPSYQHLAYRRNARAAARNQIIKQPKNLDDLKRAREDFGFFCEFVADKPPAKHHQEWNRHFVTGEDSTCLIKIAGPNIDLLAPRGSAKSTVLGLLTAWAIGVHTEAKLPLQILYLSYTVDIARSKSATIKRIIESKRYQEVFPEFRGGGCAIRPPNSQSPGASSRTPSSEKPSCLHSDPLESTAG